MAFIDTAKTYLGDALNAVKSFKVESKRADKSFPMGSIQLSQWVGGALHDAFPHLKVDVHHPELTVFVEVREDAAYVHGPAESAAGASLVTAVEEVEKQWNSQLARRFILALPREVPTEMYPQMMQEYCREHFVSKGMCCDFAIHDPDPPGHNPHCHIMLTMRAIDENGKWLPKSRKVYDLGENGERIKLPSGRWKSHKEDTVDWNEQYHAEEWRHGWELVQNKYLELAGSPERVDMRSYERQGLDVLPTVHMGAAVSALERKGIETNIGNLNRDIKAANRMMNAIRSTIRNLRNWIADIMDATKEAFAETQAQAKSTSPDLVLLLRDYRNLRKAARRASSRNGPQKCPHDD